MPHDSSGTHGKVRTGSPPAGVPDAGGVGYPIDLCANNGHLSVCVAIYYQLALVQHNMVDFA